jgi:hypothetical protein
MRKSLIILGGKKILANDIKTGQELRGGYPAQCTSAIYSQEGEIQVLEACAIYPNVRIFIKEPTSLAYEKN